MTLSATYSPNKYNGNGVQISFPVTFVFWEQTDLLVIHTNASGVETDWVLGTHYTVTGGNGTTGTIEVVTSPTNYTPLIGEKLAILSSVSAAQPLDLPEGGPLPSTATETQLDKITRSLQEKAESIGRALKFKRSSATKDVFVPEPASGQLMRWTAGGQLENVSVAGGGPLTLPLAIAEGGTGEITPAAVRTAMAVPGLADANTFSGINTFNAQGRWKKGADIASASPLVLGTDGNYFDVTGTTGFSAITVAAGTSFMLRFSGVLTITHGASLDIPGAANITTAPGDRLIGFAVAANSVQVVSYARASGLPVALPQGYISGYVLANNVSDALKDIDIAVGTARGASNLANLVLTAPLVKQLDATWVAGTNQGGRSSSVSLSSNTWYHVHAIIVGGVVDVGFDTSAVAANLITDHSATAYRRIGSIRTDASSNILPFTQFGDQFLLKTTVNDFNVGNPGTAAVLRTLTVPSGINVIAILAVNIEDGGTGVRRYCLITSPDQTDIAASNNLFTVCSGAGASAVITASMCHIRTNTSSQIRTRNDSSTAAVSIVGATTGWIDCRGKD